MNKISLWRFIGFAIVPIVILKDQLSKWWVMTHYFAEMYQGNVPTFSDWMLTKAERTTAKAIDFTDFFSLVMVWNPGVSFGMLRTDTNAMIYILSGLAIVVSIGFLIWMWREPRPVLAICIGMIAGGALGNVFDRIRFGAVADFLDFHIGSYHWPAFNVADASISLGVVLLLIDMLFFSPHMTNRG